MKGEILEVNDGVFGKTPDNSMSMNKSLWKKNVWKKKNDLRKSSQP